MRIHVSLLLASVCSLALLLPPAGADERAEIKEKVEALMREAKQLKEAGKHDEAKAVHEKLEALIKKVKGGEDERRDAPKIGREQLERAEQEIAKRRAHVAELRKAGKVDEAERVEQETKAFAEKLRRAIQEHKQQSESGDRPREEARRDGGRREGAPRDAGPDRDELRELREQVRRMHAELEELRNMVRRLAERREER